MPTDIASTTTHSATPPKPPLSSKERARQEAAEKKIDEFLHDVKITELYDAEMILKIRSSAIDRFQKVPDQTTFIGGLRTELDKRRVLLRHRTNIDRQRWALKKAELKPGDVDVSKLMEQLHESPLVGWEGHRNRLGDDFGPNTWSFVGATRAERDAILNRDEDVVLASGAANIKNYRNTLIDLQDEVRENFNVNNAQLYSWLDQGRALSKEEEAPHRKRNETVHAVRNVAEYLGSSAYSALGWTTKGILKHNKAAEDPRYHKYLALRNEILARQIHKIGFGAKDNTDYLRTLAMVNSALEGSGDILDQVTFERIQALIAKEMEKEADINVEDMKNLNKNLQALNQKMLEGLQEKGVDEEDAMWKGRLFQLFLILTPFGAFSIAGHFFNYLEPIAEILSPFFDHFTSMGEALGKIASNKMLNFGRLIFGDNVMGNDVAYLLNFGDMAHNLHLDEAIQVIIDKTPFISGLSGALHELLTCSMAQEFTGMISPMVGSPIPLLMIAGLGAFIQANTEIQHRDKVSKFLDEQNKALEAEIERAVTGMAANNTGKPLAERTRAFANQVLFVEKENGMCGKLAQFIAKMAEHPEITAEIFKDMDFGVKKIKQPDGTEVGVKRTFKDVAEKIGKAGAGEAFKLLMNDKAFKDACMRKFYLFTAVQKDGEKIEDSVAEFVKTRDPQETSQLLQSGEKTIRREVAKDIAKKDGYAIADYVQDPDAELLNIRAGIYYRMADKKNLDPGRSPKPTEAIPFGGARQASTARAG
jgi:hypothetical protein